MDHSMSPDLDGLVGKLADALNALPDRQQRQNVLQDFLNRLDFKTIVLLPPQNFPDERMNAMYRAMGHVLGAIMAGAGAISIRGHKSETNAYDHVGRPVDTAPESFHEYIEITPGGATFAQVSVGPFTMHLPAWVDPAMAAELGGMMWKVLRFCMHGYDGMDEDFMQYARDALKQSGRDERYARQYVAMGHMRWILHAAGIPTVDIFGNEIEDNEEYFYGHLFERPETQPDDLMRRARHAERVAQTTDT